MVVRETVVFQFYEGVNVSERNANAFLSASHESMRGHIMTKKSKIYLRA